MKGLIDRVENNNNSHQDGIKVVAAIEGFTSSYRQNCTENNFRTLISGHLIGGGCIHQRFQ